MEIQPTSRIISSCLPVNKINKQINLNNDPKDEVLLSTESVYELYTNKIKKTTNVNYKKVNKIITQITNGNFPLDSVQIAQAMLKYSR